MLSSCRSHDIFRASAGAIRIRTPFFESFREFSLRVFRFSNDLFLPTEPEVLTSIDFVAPEDEDSMPSDGRVKYDWYQNETHIMVGVLIKNLVADETRVVFEPTVATATLKLPDGSDYSLQLILAHHINPSLSSYKVSPVKLELKMAKSEHGPWTDLEAAPNAEVEQALSNVAHIEATTHEVSDSTQEPESAANGTSHKSSALEPSAKSTKKKDWDKIAKEIEEEEKEEGNVDDFFKKLYEGADENAKRAMVKSMQESGGTVLSTNWEEVGKKKVEVKPPDGCELKKWD